MKLTIKEVAAFCGVTERTVQKWRKDGMPVMSQRKGTSLQVDSVKFVRWLRDWEQSAAEKKQMGGTDWAAEKRKIEVERLRGEMLLRDDVVLIWDELVIRLRKAVLAIPKRCSSLVAKRTEQQARVILEKEAKVVLRGLVTWDEKRRSKL